jgi:cbb3-type cytochrome oxidase subunit 1
MKASSVSFLGAVLLLLAGMLWGIIMGISEDHSAMPAHAHLNLLGWVSLFLFGIFYYLHPAIDGSRAATTQVWIWIVGTVILTAGVGLVHTGHMIGDPIAAVGSIIVFADALLFGWLVYRRRSSDGSVPRSSIPAE